jgi:Lon protease-like protein
LIISQLRAGNLSGKKDFQKIDLDLHRRLEKYFPDWEERMVYQENREKVYRRAMRKREEALKLRQKEDFNRTRDEQDAIDYFLGMGFYQKYQDINREPNIFDTRSSFVLKMHNSSAREKFLKSFNRSKN